MAATEEPSEAETAEGAARPYPPLVEAAWLDAAGQGCPAELPMTAALALAAGDDSPALRELAGLPRRADSREIRAAFAQALEDLGIIRPGHHLARRYGLVTLAARLTAGELDPAALASDAWSDLEVETPEEHAFVALLPPCACCTEYTLGLDAAAWQARLRVAAVALVARPGAGPGR